MSWATEAGIADTATFRECLSAPDATSRVIADSVRVLIRRIGVQPFEGWVHRASDGHFTAIITPLPQNLARVDIFERNSPLARTGFYDRVQRVQRGAISAWFMTPEEVTQRNAARMSHLLGGKQFITLEWYDGRPLLTGRSRSCPMAILIDGGRVRDLDRRTSLTDPLSSSTAR